MAFCSMLELSRPVVEKVAGMPEFSCGANLVTLVLRDGRKVYNVIVAGGCVAKVEHELLSDGDELDFPVGEVVDAERQIGYYN
jgi:hypothetical protein